MKEDIQKAIRILREGGIILYPTDTIWGIGCDATNQEAVARIYDIKKRADSKSMLVLVHSPSMLTPYIEQVPDIAWEIIDAATEPLTIIYPGARNLAENLVARDQSIGIRVTEDEFCSRLIERLRKPLVSTSANISGTPSPGVFDEIDPAIIEQVDYVVEWRQDDPGRAKPSSVIRLGVGGQVEILRK